MLAMRARARLPQRRNGTANYTPRWPHDGTAGEKWGAFQKHAAPVEREGPIRLDFRQEFNFTSNIWVCGKNLSVETPKSATRRALGPATHTAHAFTVPLCLCQTQRDTADTMQHITSLLHLAAIALALEVCCVCARSSALNTNNGRQAGANLYQRQHSSHAGPLSSKRRQVKRSTAAVPWLTLASGLRGGGRGGAAVDTPRGGATTATTGVRRSAMVSWGDDSHDVRRTHGLVSHAHQLPLQYCRRIVGAGCRQRVWETRAPVLS